MLRWLFHIFAALSLVLVVALGVVWVWTGDHQYVGVTRNGEDHGSGVGFERGHLEIYDQEFRQWMASESDRWKFTQYELDKDLPWLDTTQDIDLIVIRYQGMRVADNNSWWLRFDVYTIPIWFLMLLILVPPIYWLLVFRKRGPRYRLKRSLCVSCGYNMTGTRTACPECGAVAAKIA